MKIANLYHTDKICITLIKFANLYCTDKTCITLMKFANLYHADKICITLMKICIAQLGLITFLGLIKSMVKITYSLFIKI